MRVQLHYPASRLAINWTALVKGVACQNRESYNIPLQELPSLSLRVFVASHKICPSPVQKGLYEYFRGCRFGPLPGQTYLSHLSLTIAIVVVLESGTESGLIIHK